MKTSGLRRLGLLTALGLIAVLAFSATASAKSTAPVKKVKIGYINLSDQLPFVVLVRKSIEKAAKAAGATLVECDSNLDAQKAINCAAQLKSQGVQGIVNFQLDTKARTARLRRRAEGAGHRDRHPPAPVREGLLRREQHPGRQAGRAPRSAPTRRRRSTARSTASSR